MPRNTSITLGDHFTDFVNDQIVRGRYESTSETVRAALRLLEEHEAKLDRLRLVLARGEAQLDRGEGIDGEAFMDDLINS
jgi:antitoxin ParD1/3/4